MAIYSPVGTPPGEGLPGTPEVGSISPSLDLLTKDINPQAREILNAQNPMSQFREVEPNLVDAGGAKKIDMNARERLGGFRDPMSQFKEVSGLTLPGFTEADDLDVKTVEQLDLDRDNFRPAEYFTNNPDVAKDPKRLAKLLEVVRRRDAEGLIAKRVAEAAIKNTPGTVADIGGGIKRFGERAIDVVVQPTVNVILGTLTGDLFDDQKRAALFSETRKTLKKGTAEVAAGAESATVGLVDLARTADQKISQGAITSFDDLPRTRVSRPEPIPAKPKTDQELLAQLSDDASFRQVADAAMRGEGEAAKVAGLDKETLAKEGIELDENAIRQLSLVDPVTMVATGGAFKLVGIGGKVLATAKTLEGAQKFADKLAKVAKFSAGKSVQGIGKATTFVGERLQGSGRSAALITGIGAATQGSGAFESLAIAAATKAIGPVVRKIGGGLEHAGKAIAGEVPVSANFQKVLDFAKPVVAGAETVTRGAFSGLAAGAPFAIVAQDDETAGTLFGAGAALGVAGGAGAGAFRVVQRGASRRYFGENRPVLEDVPSPGYGEAPSDALHEAQMQKLSAQDASEVNNFREILRPLGRKILAVDRPTFRQRVSETLPDATPEQLDIYENHSAFFNSKDTVYLNSDATGLLHDSGHLFDSLLTPEKQTELNNAIREVFGQKSIDDFKATYERRVGNKISDTAALSEYRAEQFAALFNNVPVTELSAPKSLLNKFVDILAEGAEDLGIDLSAGVTTPALGAPVAIGIRKLFQNAAGDVARRSIEAKTAEPTNVTPFPGESTPSVAPLTPTPPSGPPPANVVPLPGVPSRNIRVGPEDVASFKQSASPEIREAADARARETGVDYARTEAKKNDGSPTSRIIESISDSMESGRPVVQIEHLGITSVSTPEAPLGRTPRRGEHASGYAALEAAQLDVRQNAPPEIVSQYSKNFVPIRWDAQGGTPTLIAMSLDKVIANMMRVAADPKAKDLIPYPVENGKFTPEGWRQTVADSQAHAENQANGRKGDGGRLEVPEAGLSIPAENPAYTPQPLSPERANFQNLVLGLAPPLTARSKKGVTPGNVKGQILAEANLRATETPANITPARAGKQAFAEFPGRTVQEVNPLRNEMERRGVKIRELIEVTERIRAKDIVSAVARPDVNYKAPVTDTTRGGFQPAPTEFRQKNLGGRTVEEFSDYILKSSPEEWKAATDNMTGGLTGGAWNLGLGLKEAADVGVLKAFQDKLSDATKAAMKSGDFDGAYSLVSKGQFFREAHEAATGTGSAGAAFKRGTAGMESAKPPFPVEGGGFLPAEQLEVGTAESRPPELRVLPAAPGGRPPIEPPGLRPPPVAAGFQPAEELQQDETPGVRVLPAAPGGRPPTDRPAVRPPPVAAGVARDDEAAGFQPAGEYWMDSGGKMIRAPKGHDRAAKEILADTFSGTDVYGEMFKRGYTRIISSEEGIYVDSNKARLSEMSSAQRAGLEDALLSGGPDEPKELTFNGTRISGGAGFQPRTESGRKLEERGFEIVPSGELGIRKVTIKDPEGADIAQIQAVNRSAERAEILFVNKLKEAPKGVGEVLYRELGAQLKADGVTELTGTIVAPEPLAIRKKVFGDFKLIEMNGEPASYDDALAASDRIKRRTENEVAAIEPVNTISEATRFLPRVKRDAQGRPLTKSGEIDYPKWQAEGIAAVKKQRAEPIEESVPKGRVSSERPLPTGWILPDKTFVPLSTAFHEQFLAENAKDLNKRFGTALSETASVGDRLDALNAGFVRFRFDARSGNLLIEANSAKWPKFKPVVKRRLQDYEDRITGFTLSLLNNKALQVDSVTVPRMQELSEPQRIEAIDEAVDSLRVPAQ